MTDTEAEEDRFSSLPFEIKIYILDFLEIKDAVRTSSLARSWHDLWTHLPRLLLANLQDTLGDNHDSGTSNWIQRVYNLVSSLQGPLNFFQLVYDGIMSADEYVFLQSLLDLLPQKGGVEKLDLLFQPDMKDEVIRLPSFHSVYVLHLFGCRVVLPTCFQGFRRLKTLSLRTVGISNDDLNLLVRTSKNLTSLAISDCYTSGDPLSVDLSLPFMRHLEFRGIYNDFVEKVLAFSAPCLKQAVIGLSHVDYSSQNLAQMILLLVTSVAMVDSLDLSFDVLRCLSLVNLPFNFTFPCLRCLKFPLNVDTVNKRMCEAFLWLLRSMPFLDELEVELERDDDYDQADGVAILMAELLVKKHNGLTCLERTMTSVTIDMSCMDVITSIAMISITMIQFFLLNAKVLKLLKIDHVCGAYGASVMPSMIEELQKAELTSSGAKVMISDGTMSNKYIVYD
ncbi:F-box protein-like [Rhynchospora pubera]|uniref:F-box protein-like n=1 Tax=Rhynchospora pubera TaxID=906938 RepID=A0AAV8DV40_9POAL|nr:F-box protein-like [Rhynchospora pubera]